MSKLFTVSLLVIGISVCLLTDIYSKTPEEIFDDFIAYYHAGDPVQALNVFFAYNPEMETGNYSLNVLTGKLENILNRSGICMGYKILSPENILFTVEENTTEEESFRTIYVLVKHEVHPYIFKLVFYRPGEVWFGYSLDVDVEVTFTSP